jgi:hypothetical protein
MGIQRRFRLGGFAQTIRRVYKKLGGQHARVLYIEPSHSRRLQRSAWIEAGGQISVKGLLTVPLGKLTMNS